MKEKMRKIIKTQFFILLGGTLFAWTIFAIEVYSFFQDKECAVGCSAVAVEDSKNPFLTPCPYGALFFTIAFILSAIMLKNISECCKNKCE